MPVSQSVIPLNFYTISCVSLPCLWTCTIWNRFNFPTFFIFAFIASFIYISSSLCPLKVDILHVFFFFPTSSSILSTAPALVFASLPHLVCSVDLPLSSITHFYKALKFHRITLDVVPSPLVKFSNPHHFQMTAVHSPIFISHNNFLFSSSNVHMSLSSVGLL